MRGIPTSDLWILIAHGEGADSAIVSDLRAGLHKFMCCCDADTPEKCGDESILCILQTMEDEDEWELDEAGKPFSFTWEHECGHVTITRLALEDAEVAA